MFNFLRRNCFGCEDFGDFCNICDKDKYTSDCGHKEKECFMEHDRHECKEHDGNHDRCGGNDSKCCCVCCFKGEKGEKGERGCDGRNGRDGKDGCRGEKGERGCDGKDGRNGCDGKDGCRGEKGERGCDGKDGRNGCDGKDGKDGRNGCDGKDGRNGCDGKDGKNGCDGKDGKDFCANIPTPESFGFEVWNFDPLFINADETVEEDKIYFVRVDVNCPVKVNTVWFDVYKESCDVKFAQAAIYNEQGKRVALSCDAKKSFSECIGRVDLKESVWLKGTYFVALKIKGCRMPSLSALETRKVCVNKLLKRSGVLCVKCDFLPECINLKESKEACNTIWTALSFECGKNEEKHEGKYEGKYEDKDGKYGEKNEGKYEDKDGKYGEKNEGKYEDKASKYGEKNEGKYEDKDSKYGEKNEGKYEDKDNKYGEKNEGKYENKNNNRYGDR